MDPAIFIGALLIVFGIPSFAVVTIARLRARRLEAPSPDVAARLEALERGAETLQQQLAETQERVDFTERLLSKGRDEGRLRA